MKTKRLILIAAATLLAATALLIGCTSVGEGFIIPVGEGEVVPRFVFVKNLNDGTVTAFTVNPTTGALTAVAGSPFDIGDSPGRFLAVDPTSRFVYVPVFEDTLVVLQVNQTTGALTPVSGSPFDIGDICLTSAAADPSGRFVYVVDECLEQVFALSISSAGVPTNVPGSPVDVGPCPVGVTADPQTRFLYVTDECDDRIYAFTINATTGALTFVDSFTSGVLAGLRFPAVDRTGRFLYATHETLDEVYMFSIDQTTGALTPIGDGDVEAGWCGPQEISGGPIGISSHPTADFIAVANWCGGQGTAISVFSINSTTGELTQVTGSPVDVGEAVQDVEFDPSGKFLYATAPFAPGGEGNGLVLAGTLDANGNLTEMPGQPFGEGVLNNGWWVAVGH